MTKDQAIKLHDSEFWKEMTFRQRAMFQMFEEKLCMPVGVFHEAIEKTLHRPVFTREFGMNPEGLKKELTGDGPTPTLDQILELIPEDKRIVVVV